MNTWLGLLAAPFFVLLAQSANYALIRVACRSGTSLPLQIVSAAALVFSVAAAWLGYPQWRASASGVDPGYARRRARPAFFACMATIVAAFCALVQLMMWFPQWLLPACH